MKKISMSMLAAGCSLILAASGMTQMRGPDQENQTAPAQPTQSNQQSQPQAQQEPWPDQYALQIMVPDELMDLKVHDAQGEEIGTIDQIVLDARDGRIGYVVLRWGGMFGLGGETSIVPWSALQLQQTGERRQELVLVVNVPKDRLLSVPHGDVQDIDRRYGQLVHEYYGVSPYWEAAQQQPMEQPHAPMPDMHQQPAQPSQPPAQQQHQ